MARKISQKQNTTQSIIPGYTEVANDQPTERANSGQGATGVETLRKIEAIIYEYRVSSGTVEVF